MIPARPLLFATTALCLLSLPASAQETPAPAAQTEVAGPVAEAEGRVEEARAALREAMATGGNVNEARRNLQMAVRQLEEARKTAGSDSLPALAQNTPPAGQETPPAPEEAPQPAPEPAEVEPDPAPSPEPPERPAATPDQPPASPPPPAAEAPAGETTAEPPPAPPTLDPPAAPAESGEAPAPETAAPEAEKSEEPGFIKRLFGFGKNAPPTKEEAAPQTGSETPPADAARSGEPLPVFKKLPPIAGPKVVRPDSGEIVQQEGDRVIVREGDGMTVRHDDNDRFRRKGEQLSVAEEKDGATVTTVSRDNGTQVITRRSRDGEILQRYRKKSDGTVEMIIGERDEAGRPRERRVDRDRPDDKRGFDFSRRLPKLVVPIPREQYVVESRGASRSQIEEALLAPPVEKVERPYSIEEVRRSERLRAKLRRIDIDTVNFEFGAATIAEDQIPSLQAIGNALASIVANDPTEVFLIEGHTDAVGTDLANLTLSDRRAESIADILTYYFNIPPENLITQGYGEAYLKVLTAGPERENRRATVRRVTPLLAGDF